MGHDEVNELRDVLVWCGLADEEPDVLEGVGGPGAEDQETDEDGSDGVKVPYNTATDDGHGQTESVHDDVVTVVDEEDVHGRVPTEEETVDAQ